MAQRLVVNTRMQLVATNGTSDLWQDMMTFRKGLGVKRVRGRAVLCEKSGNFRFKVGVQTCDNDEEVCNAPVAPSAGTGVGYISTVSKIFVDFDPSGASDGNIASKDSYRLGLFYSSTDGTVSRGDVLIQLWIEES